MTLAIAAALLALRQAPAAGGGMGSLTPLLFQFGLIFLIFYFLIIRPQQRQRKKHEEALRNLARGDRIVTSGGIIGDVVHIKEVQRDGASGGSGAAGPTRSMDDEVTIKSGESRLIVERGRIAKIVTASGVSSSAAKERKELPPAAMS